MIQDRRHVVSEKSALSLLTTRKVREDQRVLEELKVRGNINPGPSNSWGAEGMNQNCRFFFFP